MYATAVAIWLGRQFNPGADLFDFLAVSRWMSIIMTVAAIWGTCWLGRRLFTPVTGLLAAGLFTFSPFVLHFGKDALTQGDAFAPPLVVFTLAAFLRFSSTRRLVWHAAFSIILGLTIAVKFFLVILIPPLVIYFYLIEKDHPEEAGERSGISEAGETGRPRYHWYLGAAGAAGLTSLMAVLLSLLRLSLPDPISDAMRLAALGFWAAALISLMVSVILAVREAWSGRQSHQAVPVWRQWVIWGSAISIAFAVTMSLFPSHTFNRFILPTLFERFGFIGGGAGLLEETLPSLRLYLGILLLKLGLPLGIATLIALAWGAINARRSRGLLLITLVLFFYMALLAVLPLQQPFWLMSVYPLVLLALSELLRQVYNRFTRPGPRLLFAGGLLLALGWLLFGLYQVYPNYGYYGYETTGDRWLGGSSKGYRAVVVVTNDGSTTAIEWIQQNAPPGSKVLSYLTDIHLLNYLDQTRQLDFNLVHAAHGTDDDNSILIRETADYVVVRPLEDVGGALPLDDTAFIEAFGTDPVYTLTRGRGRYEMPVIFIFERQNT